MNFSTCPSTSFLVLIPIYLDKCRRTEKGNEVLWFNEAWDTEGGLHNIFTSLLSYLRLITPVFTSDFTANQDLNVVDYGPF